MPQITPEGFAKALEAAYGLYSGPAMKKIIAKHYENTSPQWLQQIFTQITRNHQYSSPPVLGLIMKYEKDIPSKPHLLQIERTEEHISREKWERFCQDLMKKVKGKL